MDPKAPNYKVIAVVWQPGGSRRDAHWLLSKWLGAEDFQGQNSWAPDSGPPEHQLQMAGWWPLRSSGRLHKHEQIHHIKFACRWLRLRFTLNLMTWREIMSCFLSSCIIELFMVDARSIHGWTLEMRVSTWRDYLGFWTGQKGKFYFKGIVRVWGQQQQNAFSHL